MASITVKNIPDDLYLNLKQLANANHRSINSEILVCIEKAVRSQVFDPSEPPTNTYFLREKSKHYQIGEDADAKMGLGGDFPDFSREKKEAFYRLVTEIVEDLLLANAIREGEAADNVSQEEIARILDGEL